MSLAEIAQRSLTGNLTNNDYPLVKITQHKTRSLKVYVNNNAKNVINLKEFIFFENTMKIKETTLVTNKPIKLSKANTFSFTPKCKELDEIIGIYRVKKLNDSEFLLKLIK